jgi:tetratricopeptide (TPR) repeat protein
MGRLSSFGLAGRALLAAVLVLVVGIGVYLGRTLVSDRPLARGERSYKQGAWRAAALEARNALKSEPDRQEAMVLLARSEARLGRVEAARNLYLRLDPKVLGVEDLFLVGRGLIAEGRIEVGIQGLHHALERDPVHAESLLELIQIDRRTDRLAEAEKLALKLAALRGHEARGLVLLGLVRQGLKDPPGAAEAFRQALDLNPKLDGVTEGSADQVRTWLARAHLQSGKPADARAVLKEILASRPDDPERNWLLSRAALQQRDLPTANAALARSRGFNADHPEAPEPAAYVGIARCGQCHARIFRDQRASHHAQTFHLKSDLADLTLPDRPLPDPARPGVAHALAYEGSDLVYRTQLPDAKLHAIVAFVLGSGDRAMTLVGRDSGGGWHELRMTRYASISGWDTTPGHDFKPHSDQEFLGKPQDADMLRRCLSCHTTRAGVGPSGEVINSSSERGFACERCHGPAGNHLAAMDVQFSDPSIGRPRLASATAVNAICGQCHSAEGRGIAGENPNLARFQVTSLALSRCSTSGSEAMSCLTCHSPHRNAETSPGFYESKCLECHSVRVDAAGSSTACPVNPTKGCISCHMPRVQTDAPHTTFTDHRIHVVRKGDPAAAAGPEKVTGPDHSNPGPGTAP